MEVPLSVLVQVLETLDTESLSKLGEEYSSSELLKVACSSDQHQLVSLLLEAGVEPDDECLALAVTYDRKETVRILLEDNRVDPSSSDNYALKMVAKRCDVATTRLLLDSNVDTSVLDDENICGPIRKLIEGQSRS